MHGNRYKACRAVGIHSSKCCEIHHAPEEGGRNERYAILFEKTFCISGVDFLRCLCRFGSKRKQPKFWYRVDFHKAENVVVDFICQGSRGSKCSRESGSRETVVIVVVVVVG